MPNSSPKITPWLTGILGLIAFILSVIITSLRAVTIDLIYIAIASTLLSILINFIMSVSGKIDVSNARIRLIAFLFIYVLLVIWLGHTKVFPEYSETIAFEKYRNDLIYEVMAGDKNHEDAWKLKLAKHYMSAPNVILRNDRKINSKGEMVRYKGAMMMERLLSEKIDQNTGREYKHDMFYLAEFAYHFSPDDISKRWYKNAYDAGRLDALERHVQRFEENFKDSKPNRLKELEKYDQRMREKYK